MHTTRTFEKICDALGAAPRFIDNRGGARSGKTVAEMQVAAILAETDKRPTVTTVGSDTLPHLKLGAIRDFKFALEDMGLWDEARWSKSGNYYTFRTGSVIEFFGINDAPGKALGPGRDRLILNEANLLQWDIVRQMLARTSGLVMYDYNPAAPFWGTETIPARGRYQLVHSTYKDNQYIPDEVRREIEANRDTGNWWRVYGLGLIGQIEGQVFDFKVVDAMPDPAGYIESWGLDFGFTHDPTAIVRSLIHTGRREIYADNLVYQTGMTNPEIAAALKGLGIGKTGVTVWADAAEPKSIEEIKRAGLNVRACDKRIKVHEQLQQLRAWTIYVTRRSVHMQDEGRKYLYKQRPDGTFTQEPIDFFNHCFVAGTLVETPTGSVPIETLRRGDWVLTSAGPRRVSKFYRNGCKKICEFSIKFANFETVIEATPEHLVKTSQGWKRIDNLTPGDVLYLSRCSTEKHTTSTKASAISRAEQSGSTASCGNTTTGRSRRGMKYTTSTATRKTTTSATSPAFQSRNMTRNTPPSQANVPARLNGSPILTKSGTSPKSGTALVPGGSGTPSTPGKCGKITLSEQRSANAAENLSTIAPLLSRNSAQTPANPRREGMPDSTMCPTSARYAERHSSPVNTLNEPSAVPAALISINAKPLAPADVYDIEVDGLHEFFAGGILVHNCTDALRYSAAPVLEHVSRGRYSFGNPG